MLTLLQNYQTLSAHMTEACRASGRDAAAVRLLVVSKTQPVGAVRTLLSLGHRAFGENRVQEAASKFTELRTEFPDLRLHLIGALQTNKADDAVRLFDVIEVLDRPRLADALDKAAQKFGKIQECYIEVNIGDEAQKAGIAASELADFLTYCHTKQHLRVTGLMCIPPQDPVSSPYFNRMRELARLHNLLQLSMGMSSDFTHAIQCGSTEVRVGTALFGVRL